MPSLEISATDTKMLANTFFSWKRHPSGGAVRISPCLATQRPLALLVAAVLITCTVDARTAEQGTLEVSRLLHQNEFVALRQARLKPDDTVDLEGLARATLYFLDDGQVQVRSPEGTKDIVTLARGDILPLRNSVLELHNTGENPLEYLFIMSLVSPLTADPPGPSEYLIRTSHPPPASGEHGIRQVFDDEVFRIIEITLPPGDETPATVHLSGLYYALDGHPGEIVFADDRTESEFYRRERSDIWWMDSEEYAIRNTGSLPMHFLFIGIKPVARYGEYEP